MKEGVDQNGKLSVCKVTFGAEPKDYEVWEFVLKHYPIKQSTPVVIALFGGMGCTVLLFAGFLLLPGWTLGFAGYMACFIGINVILCVCDSLWLRKKGTARFAAL